MDHCQWSGHIAQHTRHALVDVILHSHRCELRSQFETPADVSFLFTFSVSVYFENCRLFCFSKLLNHEIKKFVISRLSVPTLWMQSMLNDIKSCYSYEFHSIHHSTMAATRHNCESHSVNHQLWFALCDSQAISLTLPEFTEFQVTWSYFNPVQSPELSSFSTSPMESLHSKLIEVKASSLASYPAG